MKNYTLFLSICLALAIGASICPVSAQLFPEPPTIRLGTGDIQDIAYAPDGRLLAVAESFGIWLYDTETQDIVGRLGEYQYGVVLRSVLTGNYSRPRKARLQYLLRRRW
jgi:hypothetical protein